MKDVNRIQAELAEPFAYGDIEWRISRSGIKSNGEPWAKCLANVTNRAVQQRLDDVLGIDGWENVYKEAPAGGILCGIRIFFDHKDITKWDGAQQTAVESVKGGLSGAMKRAAVQWGIGRYLYGLEEEFATCSDTNKLPFQAKFKGKNGAEIWGSWQPPKMPLWALPNNQMERFFDLVAAEDAYNYFLLIRELDEESYVALINKFPAGERTAKKAICRTLEKEGAEMLIEIVDSLKQAVASEDALGVVEIREELTDFEIRLIAKHLSNEEIDYIHKVVDASG